MKTPLVIACNDYRRYVDAILRPAMESFRRKLDSEPVEMHQVFGANLFLAHAVDYIQAIRVADGICEARIDLVRRFDEYFSVNGARFKNKKFELIDAINNALKHIRLDASRYKHIARAYGDISFNSLVEENGRVLCILDGYRFDYSRVVLRPAIKALVDWQLDSQTSILEFARGNIFLDTSVSDLDADDPIDQMIHYANPNCDDCGQLPDECACETFTYNGEVGSFTSDFRSEFNFDGVMSQISGAYKVER